MIPNPWHEIANGAGSKLKHIWVNFSLPKLDKSLLPLAVHITVLYTLGFIQRHNQVLCGCHNGPGKGNSTWNRTAASSPELTPIYFPGIDQLPRRR